MAIGLASCTALLVLDLSFNGHDDASGCARTIRTMRARLHSLELSRNPLGGEAISAILLAPALCGLTRLSLRSVGIWKLTWPWQQLRGLTALRELLLGGNNYGNEGADALADHIGALAELQALDITFCGITVRGALVQDLYQLPQLRRLACEQLGYLSDQCVTSKLGAAHGLSSLDHKGI